ncbi:GNAT family N-acetyltransferase [Alteromonas sp. 5E99-2]|uniref:GNAT family N-acetyltransferase n=1 Tax=Alteromonas sp. 5E99-2 TaxID=2817683 RepID=UPI001A98612F|nr:GNAT family N-acetyltransferase [Alteromonas sp. 5E99-2]
MELVQVKPFEFDSVFAVLAENAKWLDSINIVQWPVEWLSAQKEQIRTSVELGHYYKVMLDETLAGVVEVKVALEEIWNYDTQPAYYIHKLAVSRQFKGKGIGTSVLELLVSKASVNGVDKLRLDCVAHNSQLRQYYQNFGFNFKGIVPTSEIELALYELDINGE